VSCALFGRRGGCDGRGGNANDCDVDVSVGEAA
jgi:hypothetical protein